MKRLAVVVMALAWLLGGAAGAATKSEEDVVYDQAWRSLWDEDLAELERQHDLYQQPGQRTVAGRSKLVLFREGLELIFDGPKGAIEGYHEQTTAITRRWVQQHPQSALALVLHAKALRAHARWYRGRGFSNTVAPDAWAPFHRLVKQALQFLADNESKAMRSSSGYVELLLLGRDAGLPKDALRQLALAGLKLNLDDEGLYRAWLLTALPRWGGDAVQVDRVITEVARLSAPLHGEIFYARMYAWAGDWEFGSKVYSDTGAQWARVKAGYEQLLARHPMPVNVNAFAYQACLARDREAFLDMLERMGSSPPIPGVWGSNPQATFESCRRWAAQQ